MGSISPFLFVSLKTGRKMADRSRWLVSRVLALFPGLKYDLRALGVQEPESYVAAALASSLATAVLFAGVIFAAAGVKKLPNTEGIALASLLGSFIALFIINAYFPRIRTGTVTMKVDRELIFALRDMLVQVDSGIPLYESMVNVAHSDYGTVSVEFESAVRSISAGTSESAALQKLAFQTKSQYFKKALWQLISSLESGASLAPALRSVIESLESYQYKAIKDYSSTLNFVVLIYMLTAAAIPSVGVTFLIILSAFSGAGINETVVEGVLAVSLVVQVLIIGYLNSIRPAIYE